MSPPKDRGSPTTPPVSPPLAAVLCGWIAQVPEARKLEDGSVEIPLRLRIRVDETVTRTEPSG